MGRLTTKPRVRAALARWTLVGALSASMALFGGGTLANADTTVVSTPTVAPTTVATVAPTTVATVAPTTVATQSKSSSAPIRKRGTQAQQCIGSTTADCPVQMGLRFTNLTDSATSTFRVGDTVAVGVVIKSAIATRSFGLATYLDFDTADYQLLSNGANSAPAAPGANGVFDVSPQIGDAIFGGIGNVNTYTESTTGNVTTGKLDLDLIATLGTFGASLDAGVEVTVATVTFRVKRNEASGANDTKFAIVLRDSAAGDNRASVVTGGADVEGMNIMSGPMTDPGRDGKPTIVRTYAELIAVAPTPNPAAPLRVGDVVPVDIVLRAPAGEYVRHVNAVQAVIKVATPSFRVTDANGNPVAENAPALYRSSEAVRLDVGANATGTFHVDASNGPQVALNLTGTNVPSLAPGQTAVVGRMYVQAMRKADANTSPSVTVTMAGTDAIGERLPDGTVAFALMVVAPPLSTSPNSTQCTTVCAELPLGAVRGTTGVSLKVRSPLAATPLVTEQTPAFAFATDTFHPFLGVQGRYVDVAVIVDAAQNAAHSREVDRFDIDLTYDQNVFAYDTPEFTPAAGIVIRRLSGTTDQDPGHFLGAGSARLRLDRPAGAVTGPTEVGRVRLHLRNAGGTPNAGQAIWVTQSWAASSNPDCGIPLGTRLWSSTTPFCDIYADVAQGASARIGEFDQNANILNQPAASLQIGARLQGRRATDRDVRFVQPVDVVLMATGTANPAPRLLTPADHSWNFVPSAASYTFRTATTSATSAAPAVSACDNSWRPQGTVSNVMLATATFYPDAPPSGQPCAINSIEPGVYDVYVKGQSSVGVLVQSVPFLPGQFRTISDLVLREGDIAQGNGETDKVNNADFTAFSAAYNGYPASASSPASNNWNFRADLNQSGYVDVLDFSLLATNYGVNVATQVPTTDLSSAIIVTVPPSIAVSAQAQPATIALDLGSDSLKRATVSVLPVNSHVIVACGTYNSVCAPVGEGVVLTYPGNGSGTGLVQIGGFEIDGASLGDSGVVVRIDGAEGKHNGQPTAFSAAEFSAPITVTPDVTYSLTLAPSELYTDTISATIHVRIMPGIENHGGAFYVSFDETKLAAACPASVLTCGQAEDAIHQIRYSYPDDINVDASGRFELAGLTLHTPSTISPGDDVVCIVPSNNPADGGNYTYRHEVDLNGSPAGSYVVAEDGSISLPVTASRVRIAAVRSASVRTRSTSPNANLWVRTDATDIKTGDIIPVTVGVTTGTRAIDAAQVVLRTGSGVQLVDRDGNAVTSASALDVSTGGALPSLLHRAVDAGRGLIELAFGRQVTPSISGVSGEATLGTVYLKITGATSGDLVTIERQNGQFATLVAGDGDDLTGSLVGLSTTDAVNAPVDLAPASGVGAPVIGGSGGVAFVAPAPSANASRASAPTRSGASATSTIVRPSIATSRALTEDRASGTLTLSVPGRMPIQLKTGTLAMAPDQYCPVLRHQTYVRLDDVGIAGATFGVEAGGVLSWVSPDQAGCVNWTAISEGGLSFTKETIMQFQLARAVPGALLWVLDGSRNGELYEVDANGVATYVTAEAFAANQDHFTKVWANVIPVSTAQVDGLALRGAVSR